MGSRTEPAIVAWGLGLLIWMIGTKKHVETEVAKLTHVALHAILTSIILEGLQLRYS